MKTILITGSSRGIGKAIALRLAKKGYTIVLHGRAQSAHLDSVHRLTEAMGATVSQLHFDVSDRKMAKQILDAYIADHGAFYGVVLNAGISKDNAFPFMQDEDWDGVLSTNLDSFYNVLKPIIEPLLLARKGGRIVVITSVAGIIGNRGQVNYSASKAGLIGAAKALGLELAKRRITVNCVAPGFIETDMTKTIEKNHILPHIPMRRAGLPEEVSGAVAFLLSEDAAYITRQTLAIDGGLT